MRQLLDMEIIEMPDGAEIIVEHKKWDYKTGAPRESDFYRTILGSRPGAYRPRRIAKAAPSIKWPQIPPWPKGWIYAANTNDDCMWIDEKDGGNRI